MEVIRSQRTPIVELFLELPFSSSSSLFTNISFCFLSLPQLSRWSIIRDEPVNYAHTRIGRAIFLPSLKPAETMCLSTLSDPFVGILGVYIYSLLAGFYSNLLPFFLQIKRISEP